MNANRNPYGRKRYDKRKRMDLIKFIKGFWTANPTLGYEELAVETNKNFQPANAPVFTNPMLQSFCNRYRCSKHLVLKKKTRASKVQETFVRVQQIPLTANHGLLSEVVATNMSSDAKIKLLGIILGMPL